MNFPLHKRKFSACVKIQNNIMNFSQRPSSWEVRRQVLKTCFWVVVFIYHLQISCKNMAVIQGVLFLYLFSILILQVVHGIYLRSGNQFRRGSQTRPQISSAAIIGKCFILYTKSRILLFAVYIYLNVDKLDICSCTRKSLKNLNSV